MDEIKNIITIMIGQRRKLQKDLGEALFLSNSETPNAIAIRGDLKKFEEDLVEHIRLENDVFYVELLEKMRAKNQDTTKTEQFIAEMKIIGDVVMAFLEKYKDPSNIDSKIDDFRKELANIISALNLRIESEESGVYAYWGLF